MPTSTIQLYCARPGGSRLHENLALTLRQNGTALHAQVTPYSTAVDYVFSAEEAVGAIFEVVVTVGSPFGRDERGRPTTTPLVGFDLLEIRQRFTIDSAGVVSFSPEKHPLVERGSAVGTAGATNSSLVFNTNAVDVTAFYLATSRAAFERDFFADYDAHVEVVDGKPQFKAADFANCTFRLLGYGVGVKGVLIPPAVTRETTSVGLVELFKERDQPYTDVFDVNLFSLGRYVLSFGDGQAMRDPHGMRTVPTLEADPFHGFVRPMGADPRVPVRLSEHPERVGFNGHPRLRIAEQLVASGRKAIVMITVPFDHAIEQVARHDFRDNIRTLYSSELALLKVGGHLGGEAALGKVIFAGHGAGAVLSTYEFDDNRDDVDELWLFDPDHIDRLWPMLDRAGNARIRLVGGDSHPFLMTKIDGLGGQQPAATTHTLPTSVPSTTIWPRTSAFWARSKAYTHAYALPTYLRDRGVVDFVPPARIDQVPTASFDAARAAGRHAEALTLTTVHSDRTGAFEIADGDVSAKVDVRVAAVLDNCAYTRPRVLDGQCPQEIGLTIEFFAEGRRSASEQEFYRHIDRVVEGASIRRREWSLFGWQALSDGTEENEADYKSYFELCLHFSQFD
jgi:hypothetical protein